MLQFLSKSQNCWYTCPPFATDSVLIGCIVCPSICVNQTDSDFNFKKKNRKILHKEKPRMESIAFFFPKIFIENAAPFLTWFGIYF